jgi:triacylglycerol lipase
MPSATRAWRRLAAAACTALAALGAAPAAQADDYTRTRYPVVLVHGLLGFDQIGPVNMFYGIPSALASGGATVYVTQQPAANSAAVRGEALLANLRALQAAYGHAKFNLVGHSMGGLDVRYVAAVAPGLVASVTTVGTPHKGSAVADGIEAGTTATGTTSLVAAFVDALAGFLGFLSGDTTSPQDSLAALRSLTSSGAAAFNASFPAGAPTGSCGSGAAVVNGVRYYSASGNSVVTNVFDPADALMLAGSLFFGSTDNDGLVGRCSSHWGTVLKDDYGWNHLDEINHTFGLRNVFAADPVAFYRAQANRLKSAGL